MEFLPKHIEDYTFEYTQDEPEILKKLSRETWQKILQPRMLSGAFQGRFLSMISKIINPKKILEIGTFTGYSAICLCEGLQKNGTVYTIDKNQELFDIAQKYFRLSGNQNSIKQITGYAIEEIDKINDTFDLVFIDADKINYKNYFEKVIKKMNTGGVILSDNVLWSGKVTEKLNPKDIETKALVEYNKFIKENNRVESVILPIRDGLTISRKK